jgi:hypothetical protein
VPLGFIYVQLPNQSDPREMWRHLNWRNVTDQYAGLFFRVGGGTAADFGSVQSENTNTISRIVSGWIESAKDKTLPMQTSMYVPFEGQRRVRIGHTPEKYIGYEYIDVYKTGGENRPRNTAVYIWERV